MSTKMSVDRSCCTKKRKWEGKRVLYGFQTFGDPGCPADFDGPFRDNIRDFLQDFAKRESYDLEDMPAWSAALEIDDNQQYDRISLLVVEETIGKARRPQCDHCRCIGWSHHLVCKKRYHFIIPAQGGFSDGVLDMQTHLLHGMIHSNGFGHLLCVNGREKGSKYASGGQIMDLWDRICAMLRARKVSVEDLAKKREIELRLLHSMAYGATWFGRWGFEFGRGSYGVNQQTYLKAIEAIRGMPLSVMLENFKNLDPDLVKIVETYTKMSSNTLQTVGDLVSFMMELKARLPFNTKSAIKATIASPISCLATPCRWSCKRIELATEAIIDCLKRGGGGEKTWMPRQDVRDGARARIGDTGLLDFVLKSLGNRVVGCHVVRRAVNPVSKVLEYSLQEIQSATTTSAVEADVDSLTRDDLWKDIKYVYKHLVENDRPTKNSVLTTIPTAARIILDTKQLIKNYRGEMTRRGSTNQWGFDDDQMLRIMCRVSFGAESASPPDLVVIPPYSTFADLKEAAERALRETYHVMRNFHVERLADVETKDEDLLFGAVESGSCVVVEGEGIDMDSDWRFEGGVDTWTVDCGCGTKDDDGERMIACDRCGVWQHTRCAGIADVDSVSSLFLCKRCALGLFQAML